MHKLITQRNNLIQTLPTPSNILEVLEQHADIIDNIIETIWEAAGLSESTLTLFATGGYGRKALFIYSDVDLIILHPNPLTSDEEQKLSRFITKLWDIKIPVSHYIADYQQAIDDIADDLSRYTNFLELRCIAGGAIAHDFFKKLITAKSADSFYQSKQTELSTRHLDYGETSYLLEPNIKESPGGLRDIQHISWLLKRLTYEKDTHKICLDNLLTVQENQELHVYYCYFCYLRWILHYVAKKPEERLLFEHQKNIAKLLTYPGSTLNDKVENLMNEFYLTTKKNNTLLDILNYQFKQKYQMANNCINKRYKNYTLIDGYVDITDTNAFTKSPALLLDLFRFVADNPDCKGFAVNAIRYFRSIQTAMASLRNDQAFSSAFIQFIKETKQLEKALRLMHRYDLLDAYIADFKRLTGRMQFDLFHVYTVDKHLLMVVKTLLSFKSESAKESHPLCYRLIHELNDETTLRLAALFHDIGKGLSGDHSQLGCEISMDFAKAHHLTDAQTTLLTWLVENHLLMSITAQKKDIYSPEVVEEFAKKVETTQRLNHLYLLTVADIIATNTKLWNSWKATLLQQLYFACLQCFKDAQNRYPTTSIAAMTKQQAINLLAENYASETIEKLWASWPEKYFLRHSPKIIAKQTHAILQETSNKPIVLIETLSGKKAFELFICMHDKPLIVCNTTNILNKLHLNIIEAQVLTTKSHYTLDSYVVIFTDATKANLNPKEIKQVLEKELKNPLKVPKTRKHLQTRRQKQFTIKPQINYSDDHQNQRTILSLIASDKPGLLAIITKIFAEENLHIQNAKIATMGERAEDTFYITNKAGQPLTTEQQKTLTKVITQSLREDHGER